MNRTLKRPMFRIGGSAGTGITSGLDKPRKQYANGSEERFMELVSELREAGFYHFGTGVETFAERLLTVQSINKKGNVSAQSIHQYGAATLDSSSLHYDDQAKLFATHQMKPVLMNLEDIKINSTKVYKPGDK